MGKKQLSVITLFALLTILLMLPLVSAVSAVSRGFSQDTIPPGGAAVVNLVVKADPAAPENSLFITETLPAGWTADGISNNGAFQNGKIRWGLISGLSLPPGNVPDMTITYTAHAPVGALDQSRHQFAGTYLFGVGAEANIIGSNILSIGAVPVPQQPAAGVAAACNVQTHEPCDDAAFCSPDKLICVPRTIDGAQCLSNRMCQSDLCQAGRCVAQPAAEPPAVPPPEVPPPVPEPPAAEPAQSFGTISVGGACQANADCVENAQCINGVCALVHSAGTVVRAFDPAQASPNSRVTVRLHVDADENNPAQSLFITETPPAGWNVDPVISNNGAFLNGQIRWGLIPGISLPPGSVPDMDITYTVVVPDNAFGAQNSFSGSYIFNGIEEVPTAGVSSLEIGAVPPIGCENNDAACGVNEVCENLNACIEDAERALNTFCKVDVNCAADLVCVNNHCANAVAALLLPAPVLLPDDVKQLLLGNLPSFTPVENCAAGNCRAVQYACNAQLNFVEEQALECANGCVNGQCQAARLAEPELVPLALKQFLLSGTIASFTPTAACTGENCRTVSYTCDALGAMSEAAAVCDQCQAGACVAGSAGAPVVPAAGGQSCATDFECPGDQVCTDSVCADAEDPALEECKQITFNIRLAQHSSRPILDHIRSFLGSCIPAGLDAECQAKVESLRNLDDAAAKAALGAPENAACFDAVFNPSYCYDSDAQNVPEKKGRAIYFDTATFQLATQRDTCDSTGLTQYECVSATAAALQPFQCPNGCQNGACAVSPGAAGQPAGGGGSAGASAVLPPDQQCSSPSIGSVMARDSTGQIQSLTPRCSDQSTDILFTFTCDAAQPEGYRQEPVVCPRGCDAAAGRCVTETAASAAATSGDTGSSSSGGGGGGGGGGSGGGGGGSGGGRRRASRQVICGDGLCQSAFAENQLNCPQDCGQTPVASSPLDTSGVALAPSGAPSMPLQEYAPLPVQPVEEVAPESPYPARPSEQPLPELKEGPNIWLYILITLAALAVLGGGGFAGYNYYENKKLEAIPDYKKQKMIDYIKYYGQRGYSKEMLAKHLAQYDVPSKLIEKTFSEMGIVQKPAANTTASAVAAGGFKQKLSDVWDKIKSVFEKKEQPPREGLRQF
ncbi:MAG: hypothetical protein Q7R76_04180 [Candidatus Woesearchaeota archaeon]|nr:hypothetical protein [Candidatus Woesearchaeota archaeon]